MTWSSERVQFASTPLCSTTAIVLAIGAVGLVASTLNQLVPLAVEGVGLFLLLVGSGVRLRGAGRRRGTLSLVGAVLVFGSFPLAFTLVDNVIHGAELLPGMVGVGVLTAGLLRPRLRWSRWLVTLGSQAITIAVLMGGILYDVSTLALFAAMMSIIVSWDSGMQATNLGDQIGAVGTTATAELVHIGVILVVGGVGAVVAAGAFLIDVPVLPLDSLVLLLGSALALLAVLFVYMLDERGDQ